MQTQNRPTQDPSITGSLPTWGLWERLVPEQLADDPTSQAMLNIHLRRYETAARYVKDKRVLDIACGTGYGSKMLKQSGAAEVIGVDIAADTVEYAKHHYATPGVEFICADAEQFEAEPFDVIISFETIEHVPHPDRFLARIHSLLKPDGYFLLSVPLGETRHIDPYHLHAFSQDDMFNLFEQANFAIFAYRLDDWSFNLKDVAAWKKLYPESQASLGDLFFTKRGRQLLWDFIKHGGITMPQLLVAAQPKHAFATPPVVQHLE
ncbi:class I SAM-dependent methyltransferase [Leptolyngbya sp. 7M]|uniref:class I SAM-dependent methyltransferase n=1 Tax=Leptolyngbya sp. 7M TaxID=2812896 RepID=UPI001B8D212D|nr:class I SAM-dependent methyltransferase [Leptolyngbya sp. 7M]QYO67362.1 class I SAM-dependent methyltransferase [Leptolyngbya sp. 7M]